MGIIVIADTHFGIRKGNINMSMPGHFVDFLEWVKTLEDNPLTTHVVEGPLRRENIKEKHITSPDKIIFLGDIVELWDSEDEPVSACVSTIMPTLSDIKAEKIYVLGNHDNILKKVALVNQQGEYMYYRLGKSTLKIFPDVYPPPRNNVITPEACGNQKYLFVHGHQFDKYFTRTKGFHKIWSVVRNVSNSLTVYVPLLFIIGILVILVNYIAGVSIFLGRSPTFWLLLLLTIPRIYMDVGRRVWNRIVGMRYKEEETVTNFVNWWDKFVKNQNVSEYMNVVYGHTHHLNYLFRPEGKPEEISSWRLYQEYEEKLTKKNIPLEKTPDLVNISAWVTDFPNFSEKLFQNIERTSSKLKNLIAKEKSMRMNPELVTVGTFLYIDEDGFEFFGWNWYPSQSTLKIFNIPKEAVILRRKCGPVTDDPAVRAVLEEIGWPPEVLNLWAKDPYIR
ncbi:MAG: metallophosphoesterase [Theionarchaea archaeon]|nr:metallophosphoesterase [Theionarchaea archaeon]